MSSDVVAWNPYNHNVKMLGELNFLFKSGMEKWVKLTGLFSHPALVQELENKMDANQS